MRFALRAASQLPPGDPTDVDDAPAPAPDDDDDDDMICQTLNCHSLL